MNVWYCLCYKFAIQLIVKRIRIQTYWPLTLLKKTVQYYIPSTLIAVDRYCIRKRIFFVWLMKIISIKRKCHEKSMAFYHKWWGTIGVTMDRQRNYVLVRSAIFKLSSSLCIYSKTCLNCRHHYVYTVKPVYLLTDRLRTVRVCLLRKNNFFFIFLYFL